MLKFGVLILLVSPAMAADFRTLNFGDTCNATSAAESARGSSPIQWSRENVYALKGRDFDRDLTFTYFCPKGVLFSGNFYFPVEEPVIAVSSYHSAYDFLISTYGAPFVDNTPWHVGSGTKDPRTVPSDPRNYLTSWRTARANVAMMLVPQGEGGNAGWQLSIAVIRPKK